LIDLSNLLIWWRTRHIVRIVNIGVGIRTGVINNVKMSTWNINAGGLRTFFGIGVAADDVAVAIPIDFTTGDDA
jgi:hypothetical protein